MNFFDRYRELDEEPEQVVQKSSLRVNILRAAPQALQERLQERKVRLEPIIGTSDGFRILESPFSLGASIEYLLGYCTLQEEAAQWPVRVCDARPGQTVLDMCAAPGNKTTQLAAHMRDQGQIIALEPKGRRRKVLHNQLERMGVTNTTVYGIDGRQADELDLTFDRILVDAPCSGNFVTDAQWFRKRDLAGIKKNARLQKQLLTTALRILKPKGEIVYSTCSLEPEENELILQSMIDEHNVNVLPIGTPGVPGLTQVFGQHLHPDIKNARRFWPWRTATQGFFIARIQP